MLYGLVDCNNFFCSCERVFRPDLNGRPVVVLSNNDGCIIARSNESKALGLQMGTPYYQVRDVLERQGVAVFSSNYSLYGDMSRRVMSLLSRYTPRMEIYSIDEAFMDMTGMPDLERYAREMVAYVKRGTGIPVSMGIAPTRTLAKIASKYAKKYAGYQGVCIIDTEEKRRKALELFDVEDVWGVGRRYSRKLKQQGITSALHLAERPSSWVLGAMTVTGLRTWKELNGVDCISIDELPHKKTICASRSFADRGLCRLADVEEAVANHAAQCGRRMREQQCACSGVTMFAHTSMFNDNVPRDYIQASCHLDVATSSLAELVDAAVRMLRHEWKGDDVYYYKRAGVVIWEIVRDNAVQGSLFDSVDRDRQRRLTAAIDSINRRDGHNQVRMAVQGYSKRWHLKTEHLSHPYTTDLSQIIRLIT